MKLDKALPKSQIFVFYKVSIDSTREINCAILREFARIWEKDSFVKILFSRNGYI